MDIDPDISNAVSMDRQWMKNISVESVHIHASPYVHWKQIPPPKREHEHNRKRLAKRTYLDGIKLDTGLYDIHWCEGSASNGTADTSGGGTLEVVHHIILLGGGGEENISDSHYGVSK